MTRTLTRKITGTKPEHDLHTWHETRANLDPGMPYLTHSLTHSLTRKTTLTKPARDQHKQHKKRPEPILPESGLTFILTGNSGRFFPSAKMRSGFHRNYFQNSFVPIFTDPFTCIQITFTIATHLSVITSTVCELYSYSITSKTVAL